LSVSLAERTIIGVLASIRRARLTISPKGLGNFFVPSFHVPRFASLQQHLMTIIKIYASYSFEDTKPLKMVERRVILHNKRGTFLTPTNGPAAWKPHPGPEAATASALWKQAYGRRILVQVLSMSD
jgi:hypothetical protein